MLKVWQMLTSISQDNARGNLGAQPETTHAHAQAQTHSNTCLHTFMHACTDIKTLEHSAEKRKGTSHTQYVHQYPHIFTRANGAIGKVRPTLTVLCCC